MKKKHYLLLLLVLLTALGGMAQQYRLNRQKLCLEGGSFARKVPISNENYMYIPDFRLARGETKDVTVYLHNTLPMWMFQLYLQLPEGISVNAVNYDAGLSYWPSDYINPNSLTWGMVGNELRIISMNNSRQFPIPASAAGQAVLTLRVTAAQDMMPGNYVIDTSSFKFVAATSQSGEGYIGDNRNCTVDIWQPTTSIALNKTSTVLYKTEQEQLEVIFTPGDATERAVEWASSNPSVATIDENGLVTAHAVGTATITATSRGTVDGALLTATCVVEVRSYVESITLNKTETLIYQGENELLTATILPGNAFNQAVVWSTSDPEVATVDNTGMVTATGRGTATITATTTDGTNLSATCQVDVQPPYALEIDSLSHIRGAKAETVEVPVRLINKNAISGLQFNITLPAGVTMAMFDGMPDVWLNDDRKARNHSVDVSQLSDNQYLVLVSSPTNREFKDNDGPVVYMNLELAQYHDAGEYSIVLSDILLNEADETEHRLDDFSQKVKFYYMLGDADADTHVDVADIIVTSLTILQRPTIRFYHDAANVNDRDEVINLTDLTGIINITLGNREAEVRLAPARRGQEDESQVLTGSMALTGHYALANSQLILGLDNGNAVAAMQMDIALPGGATLKDAALTGRAGKHQLSLATLDDGRVRVLVSAFSDAEIAAGDGAVLTLTLEGMTDGEMAVTDILAVERDLTTHSLDDLLLPVTATEVDRMTACDDVRIYTQGTDIIIESPNDGTAQLVMLNGMTRPLPVKAGLNRYPMAEGYYIVRLGGKAVNFLIHNS